MFFCNIFDDVFVNHHPIGGGDEGVKAIINLGLAAGGDFVVLAFDLDAELLHDEAHLGADVLLGILRRDREITLLVADFVAEIRLTATALAGVPDRFLGINGVERAVAFGIKLNAVEDEKFGFGAEHGGVGDAGAFQISFGALGDAARVAIIRFHGAGFRNGAGERQSRFGHEGVNEGCFGVGHGEHVGGLDGFPTANGRTVEAETFGEVFLAEFGDGDGEVLPGAEGVHEFNVHHFGAGLFCHFNNALGSCHRYCRV